MKCQILGCNNEAEFLTTPLMRSGIYCKKHFNEINTGEHNMTPPTPELTTFASLMQNEFDAQFPEKGNSYKDLTPEELFNLLTQKWHLIFDTDFTHESSPAIIKNCIHIANFCMMIAHNLEEE